MRAAIVILVCLVAFLALCFVGAGAFLWQRAKIAQSRALYAEIVQAEAMAFEQARVRVELERQGTGGETSSSVQELSALKEALVAITYGDEKERISGLLFESE